MQRSGAMITPANARATRQKAGDDIEWWKAFWRWCDSQMDKGAMSDAQLQANISIMEKVYEESNSSGSSNGVFGGARAS